MLGCGTITAGLTNNRPLVSRNDAHNRLLVFFFSLAASITDQTVASRRPGAGFSLTLDFILTGFSTSAAPLGE